MEPKQVQIEQLVIDYFRKRSDVKLKVGEDGAYRIGLNSPSAQQAFFGSKELVLLFDPVRASEVLDGDLVSPTHPILEVIRNDLQSDNSFDLHVSEAHVALQLLDPHGRVTVPNLNFHNGPQITSFDQTFTPFYVFTYQVIYDTDERSENSLRLCYDACSGKLKPDILSQLDTILLEEGPPVQKDLTQQIALETLLKEGRQEVENRIYSELKDIEHQISERLSADKLRLTKHLEAQIAELRSSNLFERQQLEERLQKDIAELEQKYSCQVRVRLLSILKLWWPELHYNITLPSKRGDFRLNTIPYNLIQGKTEYPPCPICGNDLEFNLCAAGHHTPCAGQCDEEVSYCSVCSDSMCAIHGSDCTHCKKPVCLNDREKCKYGRHHKQEYFCPDCLALSFESKLLCLECLEICPSCQRNFAHEHLKECRLGNERICAVGSDSCGQVCQECSESTCKQHGLMTVENSWVCLDHFERSTCCNEIYGRSRLKHCIVDYSELLCPKSEHQTACYDCQNAVCFEHSLSLAKHRGKRVCQNCRVGCDSCNPSKHYLKSDILACKTCNKPVCREHRTTCAACGQTVCLDDQVISAQGEVLCRDDVATCPYCEKDSNIHRKSELIKCGVCKKQHCKKHDMTCKTCGKTHFCKADLLKLPKCESCERVSCSVGGCTHTKYACPDCGLTYCQHCFIEGRCRTCATLKTSQSYALQPNDLTWLSTTVKAKADQLGIEFIDAVFRYDPKHTVYRTNKNSTYTIYLLRADPPALQRLFKGDWSITNKQLRIVIRSSNKEIIQIKSESIQG